MLKRTLVYLILFLVSFTKLFAQDTQNFQQKVENLKSIKDTIALNRTIETMKAGSEEDIKALAQYTYEKNMDYRPLVALAVKRFPNGDLAFTEAVQKFSQEQDLKKKLITLKQLKARFPKKDFSYVYSLVVGDYAKAGQLDQAMSYLQKTTGRDRAIAWSQLSYVKDPKLTGKVEEIIDQALSQKPLPKDQESTLVNLKLFLLENKKDYKMAAVFAKKMMESNSDSSDRALDHYNYLLSKSGQYAVALPGLEKAIYRETADQDIKNEFIKAYQSVHPGKDVKLHMDSIQKSLENRFKGEYKNGLADKLIKEKAPDFALLDVNGKTVTYQDFKDKILVLDFWATWCGPCKASLPGMQEVVKKYENDPKVKFLFIHTSEIAGSTFETVRDKSVAYFKENHYSLPLYVDLKTKDKGENKVANSFKVKGIPHKTIIDTNGFIRFNSVGFSGSNIQLEAEMSAIIETLKKVTN